MLKSLAIRFAEWVLDHSEWTVPVVWTCGRCGKRHVWYWDDAPFPGPMTMDCDRCDRQTEVVLRWRGWKLEG